MLSTKLTKNGLVLLNTTFVKCMAALLSSFSLQVENMNENVFTF